LEGLQRVKGRVRWVNYGVTLLVGTAGFLEPATSAYAPFKCNPAAELEFYTYLIDEKA